MRKILLLSAILFAGSCVTAQGYLAKKENLVFARGEMNSLRGLAQRQILDKLGRPNSTEVYHPQCNRVEVWHYKSKRCREALHLTFINGFVTDAEYW